MGKTNGLRKPMIECFIRCRSCGDAFEAIYQSPKSIAYLRRMTKDWKLTDEYGTLCPDCCKKLDIK